MHTRKQDKVKHTTLLLDKMAANSVKIMAVYKILRNGHYHNSDIINKEQRGR